MSSRLISGGCFLSRDVRRPVRYDRRMASLQLSNVDARLMYLALQYHLGRPGSELESNQGLAEVAAALEPQLQQAVATIELSADQQRRLDSAIAGSINELKATPILEAGGKGTMPAFAETLRRLFPEAAEDPEEALPLAGHLLQLRRRLNTQATAEIDKPDTVAPRPWWQVWKRP